MILLISTVFFIACLLSCGTALGIDETKTHLTHHEKLNTDEELEEWRSGLPQQLQERRGSLHRIIFRQNDNEGYGENESVCIYLLGTAHVSRESCVDARSLMNFAKPDCLFLELCSARVNLLFSDPRDEKEQQTSKQINEKQKDIGMSKSARLSSTLLSRIQDSYAEKLGVQLGGEFREAYNQARSQQTNFEDKMRSLRWNQAYGYNIDEGRYDDCLNGCHVILGDRPVKLTLTRAWEGLSLWQKVKIIFCLLLSSIKQPSEKELLEWIESIMNDPTNDILTKSMEELGRHFPPIVESVIHERDIYMATKLLQTVKMLGTSQGENKGTRIIVAVVGAGHIPGITKILNDVINDPSKGTDENLQLNLKTVIETKASKCDDEEMTGLIDGVITMDWSHTPDYP